MFYKNAGCRSPNTRLRGKAVVTIHCRLPYGCPRPQDYPTPMADTDVVARTREWHAGRVARLTAEDGWLTLVGLHWLQEGPSRSPGHPPPVGYLI